MDSSVISLLASNWFLFGFLFALGGVMLAGGLVQRWRKRESLLKSGDGWRVLDQFTFPLLMAFAIIPNNWGKAYGWSNFGTGLLSFGGMAIVGLLMLWIRVREFAALKSENAHTAIDNPNAVSPVDDAKPVTKPFQLKATIKAVAMIASILVPIVPFTLAMFWWIDRMKASDDMSFFAGGIALMAAIVYFLLGRYPGSVWRTASIDIAASPDRVFDHIKERTDNLTNPMLVRAERGPGPAESYVYHMRDLADCGLCGYPKSPDTVGQTILAEMIEKIDNVRSHVRTTEVRAAAGPDARMMRFIGVAGMWTETRSLKILEEIPGGTRLTSRYTIVKPRWVMALPLMLANPTADVLRFYKARIEGTPDTSPMADIQRRLDAARAAPKHCGCSAHVAPKSPDLNGHPA